MPEGMAAGRLGEPCSTGGIFHSFWTTDSCARPVRGPRGRGGHAYPPQTWQHIAHKSAVILAIWSVLSWRCGACVMPSPLPVPRGFSTIIRTGEVWWRLSAFHLDRFFTRPVS